MRSQLSAVTFVGLALVCASCNSDLTLTEYANQPSGLSQAIDTNPLILVGTIAQASCYVGHRRQSRWVPRPREYTVQLARVVVRVETLLQADGQIPMGEVPIYYFLWGTERGYGGPARLGDWSVGDRVMFFLRWESGYLRTICDQYKNFCTIQVFSGAHPGFRTANPAYSVIDLLLTRGQGAGDEQMIRAIDTSRASDIDPDYAVKKFRKLIAEETPAVATAACQRLRILLDSCAPPPWNFGDWVIPCNERSNMHLPCPGACCGYGEKAINAPKAHR